MNAAADSNFKRRYEVHLKHLALNGLQPKTIEACSRAIRRIGASAPIACRAPSPAGFT